METAGLIGLVSVLGGLAAIGATGKDFIKGATDLVNEAKQGAVKITAPSDYPPLFGKQQPPPSPPPPQVPVEKRPLFSFLRGTVAAPPPFPISAAEWFAQNFPVKPDMGFQETMERVAESSRRVAESRQSEQAAPIVSDAIESSVLDRMRAEKSSVCLPEGEVPPEGYDFYTPQEFADLPLTETTETQRKPTTTTPTTTQATTTQATTTQATTPAPAPRKARSLSPFSIFRTPQSKASSPEEDRSTLSGMKITDIDSFLAYLPGKSSFEQIDGLRMMLNAYPNDAATIYQRAMEIEGVKTAFDQSSDDVKASINRMVPRPPAPAPAPAVPKWKPTGWKIPSWKATAPPPPAPAPAPAPTPASPTAIKAFPLYGPGSASAPVTESQPPAPAPAPEPQPQPERSFFVDGQDAPSYIQIPGKYVEAQENAGCGRHALNNLLGGRNFVKENKEQGPVNSINDLIRPVSLMALCRYLEKDIGEPNACPDDENYNYNVLLAGLGLFGFESDDMQLTSSTAGLTDAPTVLGFLVHKTNPGHWYVLKRKGDNMYSLIDSLEDEQTKQPTYDDPKPLNQITLRENTDTIFRIIKKTGKTIDYKNRIGEGRKISENVCVDKIDKWYADTIDGKPGAFEKGHIKPSILNDFFTNNPTITLDALKGCLYEKTKGTQLLVPSGYQVPTPTPSSGTAPATEETPPSSSKSVSASSPLPSFDDSTKYPPAPNLAGTTPSPEQLQQARDFLTKGFNPRFETWDDTSEYVRKRMSLMSFGETKRLLRNQLDIANHNRLAKDYLKTFNPPITDEKVYNRKLRELQKPPQSERNKSVEAAVKRNWAIARMGGGTRKNTFRRRRGVTTKKKHVRRTSYRKNRANRPHSHTRRRS